MEIFAETERLVLREILPTDIHGMFELYADPAVYTYLKEKPVENIAQVKKSIALIRQQYSDNGIGRWAVIEKSTGDFMGWSGLKLIKECTNNHNNYYDLGYRLIKKFWGKGIAAEAAKVSLAYGFMKLNQDSIYAMADLNNHASTNVLAKCGLKFMEIFELDGMPTNWYKITKNEWLEITA